MAKNKKPKPNMLITFANKECAKNFALTLQNTFQDLAFFRTDETVKIIVSSRETRAKIKETSEMNCYHRRSFRSYDPC